MMRMSAEALLRSGQGKIGTHCGFLIDGHGLRGIHIHVDPGTDIRNTDDRVLIGIDLMGRFQQH